MLVVNEERGNGLTRDQGGVYGMLLTEERMTKKCVQIIIPEEIVVTIIQ